MSLANEEQNITNADLKEDQELTRDENEMLETENDQRSVRVGDDLNEPDPEHDYTEEATAPDQENAEPMDPVPSPS